MAKKSDDGMEQISIRLPKEWIKELGKAGSRTIGPEIRRRLEASFRPEATKAEEAADPRTKELLDAVAFLANNVNTYYGLWSQDRFAFEILQEAINRILTQRFAPTGKPIANPDELAGIVFGEGDHLKDKEAMGRMIAAFWLSSNPKVEA
jgi:hypothetical protein